SHAFVGAADQVNMVLASARGGELRVAPPDGPGDDFGPMVGELPGDFGEEAVIANHHADLAETGVEDRVFRTGRDAALHFAPRQAGLAILADELTVGTDQHRNV